MTRFLRPYRRELTIVVALLLVQALANLYLPTLNDPWLFHGTIRENIAYGRENATEEQVQAAARAARVRASGRSWALEEAS